MDEMLRVGGIVYPVALTAVMVLLLVRSRNARKHIKRLTDRSEIAERRLAVQNKHLNMVAAHIADQYELEGSASPDFLIEMRKYLSPETLSGMRKPGGESDADSVLAVSGARKKPQMLR